VRAEDETHDDGRGHGALRRAAVRARFHAAAEVREGLVGARGIALPNSPIAQLPDGQRHAAGAAGAPRAGPQRMTRRPPRTAGRATDREVGVVAAVLVAGSEKAAAHRLGLSHSTVKHHLANARPRSERRRLRSSCGSWRRGCRSPMAWPKRTNGGEAVLIAGRRLRANEALAIAVPEPAALG